MAKPALLGGAAVTRKESWPNWPQWDECEALALQEVLGSGRWQAGPQVEAFEREFGAYQGGVHAVCVDHGEYLGRRAARLVGKAAGSMRFRLSRAETEASRCGDERQATGRAE